MFPTATDGCKGLLTATTADPLRYSAQGEYVINWVYDDGNGNRAIQSQNIIVRDPTPPLALCQNIAVLLRQQGDVSITPAQIDNGSKDACGIASMTLSKDYFTTANVGTNDVTLTVTDNNGNVSSCGAVVTVEKRPVELEYTSLLSIQYSDLLLVKGVLRDVLTGNVLAGKNVNFTLGSQSISATTDASGEAVASLIITQAPGSYQLLSSFDGDNIYLAGNDNDIFAIEQEDARLTYTGALFASTSSSSATTAKVTLSVTIQDITAVTGDAAHDPYDGDIATASLTFFIVEANQTVEATVGYVVSSDRKTGTATASWLADIGPNNDSKQFTVRMIAGDHYVNTVEEYTVITVSKPLDDFVTGGGYINLTSSNGEKAGDAGTKNNFGFNIKYNKRGTNLQGNINTIIRRTEADGVLHVYQIKGNAMTSLAVQDYPTHRTAVFNGKANIQDITDPLLPVSVDGNAALQVELTDRGEPGTTDQIAITVWNKSGGLWFASNWNGAKTEEQILGGGNIVIHIKRPTSVSNTESPDDGSYLREEPVFTLESYPNPFDYKTEIKFSMLHAVPYSLDVYDLRGVNIKKLMEGVAEAGKTYRVEFDGTEHPKGVYVARLTTERGTRYIKLIIR